MRITKKGMLKEVKLLDTLDNLEPKVKRMLNLMYKRYVPKNDPNWRWWQLTKDTIIKELMEDVGLSKRDAYKLTTFFIKHGQSLFNDYSYDISDKELFSVDFADNLNRYTEETKGNPFNTLKKIDTFVHYIQQIVKYDNQTKKWFLTNQSKNFLLNNRASISYQWVLKAMTFRFL